MRNELNNELTLAKLDQVSGGGFIDVKGHPLSTTVIETCPVNDSTSTSSTTSSSTSSSTRTLGNMKFPCSDGSC